MADDHGPEYALIDRYMGLQLEWRDETERGLALTAAAFLDDTLKELIEAVLIPNKGAKELFSGPNAPLGSFSTRISAAFAMGLISEDEYQQTHLVRKIRNVFAHTVRASFSQPPVSNLCAELSKLTGINLRVKDYDKSFPREEFGWNALTLITALLRRPQFVEKHKLKLRDWVTMNNEHYGLP